LPPHCRADFGYTVHRYPADRPTAAPNPKLGWHTGHAMIVPASLKEIASSALKRAFPGAWISIHARRLPEKPAERASRLLPCLVPRSEVSLDIGANIGDYTWHLKALSSEVWAFEPNPALIAWLRRCFAGRNVVLRETALGERDTKAPLSIPRDAAGREIAGQASIENDFGRSSRSISVQVERLDSLELPKVGFMKIDVEGHELAVLRGGIGLLRRDRPTILVEIEERHRPEALRSTWEWLQQLGYEGFFYLRDEIHPIADFSAERDQDLEELGGDAYVNNFIFVAREDIRRALLAQQPASNSARLM
jgi:FkbM family methyltransferase